MYALTWRQLTNVLQGYRAKEAALFKDAWERTRVIAYTIHTHFVAKKDRKKVTEFLPFDWDQKNNK